MVAAVINAMGKATAKLCIQRPKNCVSMPVFNATNNPDMISAMIKDIPNIKAIRALRLGMAIHSNGGV